MFRTDVTIRRRVSSVLNLVRPPDSFDLFFFSSRRRHTRYIGDWSSDVCSSDLGRKANAGIGAGIGFATGGPAGAAAGGVGRSEERRVGKECRSRGAADR